MKLLNEEIYIYDTIILLINDIHKCLLHIFLSQIDK